MQSKPVVKYQHDSIIGSLKVGKSAMIKPIDHASPFVSNTQHVYTSSVVKINADNSFETMNTLYVPTNEKQKQGE